MDASSGSIPFEAELSFLRQPGSYEAPAGSLPVPRVQAIETHMSWVFLTPSHAYKLKKHVHFGPMDGRTLAMRRFYCDEEVRLNRRLAPSVYLGTVALVLGRDGHLGLGGEGETVDWLVRMRRLPHEEMLDDAILSGRPVHGEMQKVAVLLAAFHAQCPRCTMTPQAWFERVVHAVTQHVRALCEPRYALAGDEVRALGDAQLHAAQRLRALLERRVADGCVIEGHGDLRAEHVHLGQLPEIIDCIEFSRELRMLDRLDEAGFLALECERLHAASLAAHFLDSYMAAAGEARDCPALPFYQSVRATTRAMIAVRHIDEPHFRYSRQWQQRAREYLQLAHRHLGL